MCVCVCACVCMRACLCVRARMCMCVLKRVWCYIKDTHFMSYSKSNMLCVPVGRGRKVLFNEEFLHYGSFSYCCR